MMHIGPVTDSVDRGDKDETRGRAVSALQQPLISYFRRRVVEQDDVPDLVQEVFLRLTARGEIETIDNLQGYVFQIAANVLVDRGRRQTVRHHRDHVEFDPDRDGDGAIAPDRIVAARAALDAVRAVITALPQRTQTIFVLRRIEGMRYREIATRLGISVSAVEKHMVRAVEQLAKMDDLP